jgi:transcriptional regulator with XRE-family HTH domain
MEPFNLYTEKEILNKIRQSLRSRRVAVGFTQKEAARRAGISPRTVQNLETKGIITLYNLLKLLFVYRMEHKILDAFIDRDWWKMDELKMAEKNVRVRKYDK